MNTTISNNGLPKLPQAPSGQGSATQNASGTAGSEATAGSNASDDRVQLTDSARALQEAARTGAGATVDTKKVEQVRQALANGSYKIDPSRIADRMMSLESQLTTKS
ncbi:flagellar biosynthesis anti-sigma factor FlgM [Dyella solisilvae]|uniref:Negative regulator of flagellin synthesis n=1 Tax=Dyella solisilvae TaxID=1920168 RepID=A0A370K4Y1_9GAMM|nr:flagellar biosynthesis anti-sigma factor FlgM [Dyella solisilvae]RDI97709.1 flagellar biosynthesis anti-sigma factor FlgM [Dyella solisilvae]